MIFYNQTATVDGSVVLAGKVNSDRGGSGDLLVDLAAVEADVQAVTVVASTDQDSLAVLERLEWVVTDGRANPVARFPVAGITTERALVLGEVYRRAGGWKLRAVGQGWQGGLAGLATDYGVTVNGENVAPDADPIGSAADVEFVGGSDQASDEAVETADPEPSVDSGGRSDAAPGVDAIPNPGLGGPTGNDASPSDPPLVAGITKKVRVAAPKPVTLPPVRLADDPGWQSARLFSISGIGGVDEQEKRATSALLWAMAAVRPLGRAITARAGAPSGALETFIEVGFPLGEHRVIPDGVIRIARGQKVWTALVEVKTGDAVLGRDQIETYLRLAKRRKFDTVLSISNQVSTDPGVHPVELPAKSFAIVGLVHISWSEVMHEVRMLMAHHRFTDPLPLWILTELDRYLGHPRSGAMPFNDMGPSWVPVRESAAAGTLRPGDLKAVPVVNAWQKLMRQSCLGLTARLGVPVRQIVPRRLQGDPVARLDEGTHLLGDHGLMAASVRVPDAAGPIGITADLRTSQVIVKVEIGAPREGALARRVGWLVRQLKDAPDELLVEARFAPRSETTCERLADVRSRPQCLLRGKDWEPTSFVISRAHPMGTKRSGARGSFVSSVNEAIDQFYTDVVERIRPWTPPAPALPAADPEPEAGVPS